jgi:hypothetical protein
MQKDDIWCKVNEKNKRLINAIRNHRNNKLNEPVRKHFETNKKAKELLEQVKSFQVTR